MSDLHSRQSVNSNEAERARERIYKAATLVPLADWDVEEDLFTDHISSLSPMRERAETGPLFTGSLPTVSAPLRDTPTTSSLVLTLQSTLTPQTGKAPIIIPGNRSRTPYTDKLPAPRRLHPSIRLGILGVATVGILLFTLCSLTPLGSGQSGIGLFDGAIKWAQEQQVTWDGMVSRIKQAEQPAATGATGTTAPVPPATGNQPTAPLPRGVYVDIARQAAIRYGISPDSFVRQIQQESHFDPNAQSPNGAVGIAQFIPSTAASLGVNPYDPASALNGAARLMASLSSQFGGDYAKALAAYNAGPGAVQSAVNMGGAAWLAYMPPETQHYVHIIMG